RQPIFADDGFADVLPYRCLRDEIDIGIGVGLPSFALEDPARLPTARRVAGTRDRVAELAVRILRIFLHHAGAREALLIAQLHAAQIEHAVLHRGEHLLSFSGGVALIKRGNDAECEMQAGAAVADLRAGHDRWAVVEAGGGRRSAGALRDILIHLAILIRAGSEALHRGGDHARVARLAVLPGEPHGVYR